MHGVIVGEGPREPLTLEQLREGNAALHATIAKQAKKLKLQTATSREALPELQMPALRNDGDAAASSLYLEDSGQSNSADVINTVYDALGIAGDEGV